MSDISSILADQQKLIEKLKKNNAPIYNWFVKQGVDFGDLQKSASTFIAAASMLFSSPQLEPSAMPFVDEPAHLTESKTPSVKPRSDKERADRVWAQYGQFIRESAAEYGVDPNLIFATIMIESGGNPYAIRLEPRINDASYGLGQLLYGTARGLGYKGKAEGLFDPATNIDLIARYHQRTLKKYGHLTAEQLTTAYNAGSPYRKPIAGHLTKFNKWYNRVETLELDIS